MSAPRLRMARVVLPNGRAGSDGVAGRIGGSSTCGVGAPELRRGVGTPELRIRTGAAFIAVEACRCRGRKKRDRGRGEDQFGLEVHFLLLREFADERSCSPASQLG